MKKLLFILITSACSLNLHAQSYATNPTSNITPDDIIYTTPVEVMPEYKGGMDRFYERLRKIKYLHFVRTQNVQGKVIVNLVIEKDGTVSNARILNGLIPAQDREVLRVVNSLRKWKPGMHNGQPVRVAYNVPLNFKLVPVSTPL
jgi:protein TonB